MPKRSNNKNNTVKFLCNFCNKTIVTNFVPSVPPSCPYCGSDTIPDEVSALTTKSICNTCHSLSDIYSSDKCSVCNSSLSAFTGNITDTEKDGGALHRSRTLYSSSRGPEGGTIPRWKIY